MEYISHKAYALRITVVRVCLSFKVAAAYMRKPDRSDALILLFPRANAKTCLLPAFCACSPTVCACDVLSIGSFDGVQRQECFII